MKHSIFKPCDIRGIYPNELNEEAVYRIARAFATLIQGSDVVLAGDVRLSTLPLKHAVAKGLMDSGCVVHDIGIVPTPVFYYARRRLGVDPGIMVTASHNPPEYNGLKIVLGRLPVTDQDIEEVKNLSHSGKFAAGSGKIVQHDIVCQYEDWLVESTSVYFREVRRTPKVVVDCGNGCYSEIAPRILDRLGVPTAPLFCKIDGTFPSRSPNPAVPTNLRDLSAAVASTGADLGIAFDGDGDRVSFIDETGSFVVMDKAIAVISANLPVPLARGDKVVLDIKCSAAVAEMIRAFGALPLIEKSGHTYIKRRMITERARFGGEISGHLFFQELNGGDDGLYSAILMAGIVARKGSLSRLTASVPSYATTPDIRLRIDSEPNVVLETIAGAFPPQQVCRLDGVRVEFEDGWGLARASVTEPVITMRFEGKTPDALNRVMNDFLAPVPEIRQMVLNQWSNADNDTEE